MTSIILFEGLCISASGRAPPTAGDLQSGRQLRDYQSIWNCRDEGGQLQIVDGQTTLSHTTGQSVALIIARPPALSHTAYLLLTATAIMSKVDVLPFAPRTSLKLWCYPHIPPHTSS